MANRVDYQEIRREFCRKNKIPTDCLAFQTSLTSLLIRATISDPITHYQMSILFRPEAIDQALKKITEMLEEYRTIVKEAVAQSTSTPQLASKTAELEPLT